MKVLLFGKNGQVGNELCQTLLSIGEIIALDRSSVDLENTDALIQVLEANPVDVIVNAAAYTAVDKAESEENRAFQINEKAVGVMAAYAKRKNVLLVHYSTDYVFDGNKQSPYEEDDIPNPLNTYGKSKWAGEKAILQSGCFHLIFRTSWVYSYHGHNFIKTIWRLGKERDALNVVTDQIGSPTSAELIADITTKAITAFYAKTLPEGIYHLTASGQTSWHNLACYLMKKAHEAKMPMKLSPERIKAISTEEYPLPALRPKNSRLNNFKLSQKLNFAIPEWSYHVDRLIDRLIQE